MATSKRQSWGGADQQVRVRPGLARWPEVDVDPDRVIRSSD